MIPYVIHTIWIGPKKPPLNWLQTWKDRNPGAEFKHWTEKEIDELDLYNRKHYETLYNKGIFDGAADIARVEILFRHGGVYVDIDSECLQSIWSLTQDCDFLAGYEYDRRVGNGVIGATAGHLLLQLYNMRIHEATVLTPPCYTIGGTLLTTCVNMFRDEAVRIMPKRAFYPTLKDHGEDIYCRQKWYGTKGLYA